MGVLQTQDGETFVAEMRPRLWQTFKDQLDLEQPHCWKVYPRTKDLKLHCNISGVRKEAGPIPVKADYFSVRGQVTRYNEKQGIIRVSIRPNRKWSKVKPYALRLEGFLPDATVGWFYNFAVERSGHQLVMVDAERIAEIPKEPKESKEEKKSEKEVPQSQEDKPEGESTQSKPDEKPQ